MTFSSPHPEVVDDERVREHLRKIELSKTFGKVPIQKALLRFLVEEWLAGRADQIKAVGIVETGLIPPPRPHRIVRRTELTKGPPAQSKNQQPADDIENRVRVAAGRLRQKLLQYYHSEGCSDQIRIDIPVGAYKPAFSWASGSNPQPVPEHVKAEAKEQNLDLHAYRDALRLRYDALPLEALLGSTADQTIRLSLHNLFVDRDLTPLQLIHSGGFTAASEAADIRSSREQRSGEGRTTVAASSVLLGDLHGTRVVLLGGAGSGKSTLLRHLALTLMQQTSSTTSEGPAPRLVPFIIELKTFAAYHAQRLCDTFVEYLEYASKIEHWRLTSIDFEQIFSRLGSVVVAFDGMDEVHDLALREQLHLQIAGFARHYPQAKVIVTSRPTHYRRRILEEAGFQHFILIPLDPPRIHGIVDRFYTLTSSSATIARGKTNSLTATLSQSPRTQALIANPLMLILSLLIAKDANSALSRSSLLHTAIDVLLEHWDAEKYLSHNRRMTTLLAGHKKELLCALAVTLQTLTSTSIRNYLTSADMTSTIRRTLTDELHVADIDAICYAQEIVATLQERGGILTAIDTDAYRFSHQLFYDYLIAVQLLRVYKQQSTATEAGLVNIFKDHWDNADWTDILLLICEMVDAATALTLVTALAFESLPLTRIYRAPPPSNVLVALMCLREVRCEMPEILAVRLLRAICRLIDACGAPESEYEFLDSLVDAALDAGAERWPGRELIMLEWLSTRSPSMTHRLLRALFGLKSVTPPDAFHRFVGRLGHQSSVVYELLLMLLRSERSSDRVMVPKALAVGWPSSDVAIRALRETTTDPDPGVRMEALQALNGLCSDDDDTFEITRTCALSDGYEGNRVHAVALLDLHHYRRPSVISLLGQLAEDRVAWVRDRAIKALAHRFPEDSAVHTLIREKMFDEHDRVCWAAMNCSAILTEGEREQNEVSFVRRAASDVRQERLDALRYLIAKSPARKEVACTSLMTWYTGENDEECRREIITMAAEFSGNSVILADLMVHVALNEPNAQVRVEAVKALCRLRDNERVDSLGTLLEIAESDPDADVRYAAIDALSDWYCGDTSISSVLASLATNDDSDMTRLAALRVLTRDAPIADFTYAVLKQCVLAQPHSRVREYALRVLWMHWRNLPETIECVRAVADESGLEEARWAALEMLSEQQTQFGKEEVASTLQAILQTSIEEQKHSEIRKAVDLLSLYFPEKTVEVIQWLSSGRMDTFPMDEGRDWLITLLARAQCHSDRRSVIEKLKVMGVHDTVLEWWIKECEHGTLPYYAR